MIEKLRNVMRLEAQRAMAAVSLPTVAYVSSFDPNTFTAKVMTDPEDPTTESGWLPVGSLAGGAGWGLYAAPMQGDQVTVDFIEGDSSSGMVRCAIMPAGGLKIPSGEMWMVHNTGSELKFTSDGKIAITGTVEIDVGNGSNPFLALVTSAFMAIFNGHTHDYLNGSTPAISGVPNTLMTDAELTTTLKGN